MRKTLTALSFFVSVGAVALAAEPPGGPPKVLQIIREEVKPGKGAAHEKVEVGWPAAFRRANSPAYYLAMTSMSGPSEAWFTNAWDSFATAEKEGKAIDANKALTAELERLSAVDGELLSRLSGMWAAYREDLSYRPDFDVRKMRYFSVITIRVNPGHESEFAASRKLLNDAHDKAKIDEHWATYQVVSGAPGGTYIVFIPLKSLAEMDMAVEMHGKPFREALGDDNRARLQELSERAIKGSETALFAFSPKMSYLSKDFTGADPEFWEPKPEPAAAKGKKEEAKK